MTETAAGFPARVQGAFQRWPRLAASACGVVAASGFPPLNLWPLALLGMAGLALLVRDAASWRRAALLGWLFGVGHFTFANNWIAAAFTFQSDMPVFLGWIAVPTLAVYLAVYPAIAAGLAKGLGGTRTVPLMLALGGAWAVTEWLRGWVFTGFAWDPLGLVFLGPYDRSGIAALLPWLGTYALSGLAAMIGAGLFVLARRQAWWRMAIVGLLLAVGMYMPGPAPQAGTQRIALVQPGFRQDDIDDSREYENQFRTLARLTAPRSDAGNRLVLWPESGLPDYLRPGYPARYYLATTAGGDPAFARGRIGKVLGPGSLLLTGAVDLEVEGGRAVGAYNAVTAIDATGEIVGSYYKAHLVPYGEYLALRWLLEPLGATRLVAGSIDFVPGPGPRTLDLGRYGRVGMQICYEIVFPGEVVDRTDRPDWIYNPSNDGWFGRFGSPQFVGQARMRAIEEGLPVIRGTVSGISAVIDARGIVRQHLPTSFTGGRIDTEVPPALAPSPFALAGNALSLGWAGLMLALSLLVRRRTRS